MNIELDNAIVYSGSNLDILPTLPDNSVDSIVTDPPYELGFMGKKWDSTGIAYSVELWTECMRVLKPGGHLLAFGGSRTWHRLAVAIEDAGFEMRDSIAWLYGSGFPKSLDISKAIDKRNGKPQPTIEFREFLRAGKARSGLTSAQIDKALGFTSAVFSPHYVGDNAQIEYPTKEKYALLKILLELDDSFDYLIEWAEAEREVIGKKPSSLGGSVAAGERNQEFIDRHKNKIVDITAPATSEAKQWQGWGTALKPAFEPVVVARKPLIGTVAENVLTYGTGGLNIDASRISYNGEIPNLGGRAKHTRGDGYGFKAQGQFAEANTIGRWPANVILDEDSAKLLDKQANASRFFYIPKPSMRDRNEGLDEINIHPTVKPTDLMRYLIKLVTPKGGTVLDPFAGSGSTGKAALLNGFKFIGIELTEQYLPIIEGRLKWANEQAGKSDDGVLF